MKREPRGLTIKIQLVVYKLVELFLADVSVEVCGLFNKISQLGRKQHLYSSVISHQHQICVEVPWYYGVVSVPFILELSLFHLS